MYQAPSPDAGNIWRCTHGPDTVFIRAVSKAGAKIVAAPVFKAKIRDARLRFAICAYMSSSEEAEGQEVYNATFVSRQVQA